MFNAFDLTFPLLLSGCWVLALAGVGCLICCRGKNHRRLAWTAVVFLAAMALLFLGSILLGIFRLTWRSLPMLLLGGVLLVSGWAGILFTMACVLPMEMPELSKTLRRAAKGVLLVFAAAVLLVTLWAGPLALLFGFYREERVVEYRGQTLLEVDDGFLDSHYSYYAYCGPLVRGTLRIYDSAVRIDGSFD